MLGRISNSGLALFAVLANVALVPVLTFYFLRDWDVMVAQVREPAAAADPADGDAAGARVGRRCSAASCAASSA